VSPALAIEGSVLPACYQRPSRLGGLLLPRRPDRARERLGPVAPHPRQDVLVLASRERWVVVAETFLDHPERHPMLSGD
jgi:hypothetical protein